MDGPFSLMYLQSTQKMKKHFYGVYQIVLYVIVDVGATCHQMKQNFNNFI